jgi:anoctamin-10
MTGVITSVYSIDTVVGEVYAGPGKMFLALIPTVLFAGLVPQVTKL